MTHKQVFILTVLIKLVTSTFPVFEIKNPGKPAFDQNFYEDLLDSDVCQEQLSYIQNDINLQMRFIDFGLRLPKGIPQGNILDLGDYHGCLGIREETGSSTIEGKYCQIHDTYFELGDTATALNVHYDPNLENYETLENLKKSQDFLAQINRENILFSHSRVGIIDLPTNTSLSLPFTLAVCVPKTCTVDGGLRGILNSSDISLGLQYNVGSCRVLNDKLWAPADYVAMIIFSIIGLLTILSTGYDVQHQIIQKKDPKTSNNMYTSFSVYTNIKRLTTFSKHPRNLECVDGLRVISMMWVILGHCFITAPSVWNNLDVIQYIRSWKALWLIMAPFSVDSFFMFSGMLLVYSSVGKISSVGLLKKLHLFYLQRILRIFPVLATVILLQASIFHRIADGPIWETVASYTESCRSQWWMTLLFIQNYVNTSTTCISHSWYIAIDMQLFFISPIVLFWVLSGKRRFAWTSLTLAVIITIGTATTINFIRKFPGWVIVPPFPDRPSYSPNFYQNTVTRSPPYFIGMFFGYVLYEWRDKNLKIPKILAVIVWICTLGLMMSLAYPLYLMLRPGYDMWILDATFNSFARPLWCLAICWIIFACHKGYGGPINQFLSHRIWKLPSRLSYAMYLFHFPMQFVIQGTAVRLFFFSVAAVLYELFLSQLVVVFVVSFVLTVLIDSPLSTLVKLALGGGAKEQKKGKSEGKKRSRL